MPIGQILTLGQLPRPTSGASEAGPVCLRKGRVRVTALRLSLESVFIKRANLLRALFAGLIASISAIPSILHSHPFKGGNMKPDKLNVPFTILLKMSTFGFNPASKGLGVVLLEGIQTSNVERFHDGEGLETKVLLPFESIDVAIQQLDPLLESLKTLKETQLREAEEKGVPLSVHLET